MTKRFANKNERRFWTRDRGRTDCFGHVGDLVWDYRRTGGRERRHLPQTQEEEEGDEQRHHRDAVTQEIYDHSYLVVHLAFFLWGEKRDGGVSLFGTPGFF